MQNLSNIKIFEDTISLIQDNPFLRVGQSFLTTCYESDDIDPSLLRNITDTPNDPFYSDNNLNNLVKILFGEGYDKLVTRVRIMGQLIRYNYFKKQPINTFNQQQIDNVEKDIKDLLGDVVYTNETMWNSNLSGAEGWGYASRSELYSKVEDIRIVYDNSINEYELLGTVVEQYKVSLDHLNPNIKKSQVNGNVKLIHKSMNNSFCFNQIRLMWMQQESLHKSIERIVELTNSTLS